MFIYLFVHLFNVIRASWAETCCFSNIRMNTCVSLIYCDYSGKWYTKPVCPHAQSDCQTSYNSFWITLSSFQGISVCGVFPIGALGRYPRLCTRRFRLERRLSFPERSAHGRTGLPLSTPTALDGAHRTVLEAVQTPAGQQKAFQGTDPRGSTIAPGTRWNVRCGGSDTCRRETLSAVERKVSTPKRLKSTQGNVLRNYCVMWYRSTEKA